MTTVLKKVIFASFKYFPVLKIFQIIFKYVSLYYEKISTPPCQEFRNQLWPSPYLTCGSLPVRLLRKPPQLSTRTSRTSRMDLRKVPRRPPKPPTRASRAYHKGLQSHPRESVKPLELFTRSSEPTTRTFRASHSLFYVSHIVFSLSMSPFSFNPYRTLHIAFSLSINPYSLRVS